MVTSDMQYMVQAWERENSESIFSHYRDLLLGNFLYLKLSYFSKLIIFLDILCESVFLTIEV